MHYDDILATTFMTNKSSWTSCTVLACAVLLATLLPGNLSAQTYGFQWAKRVASTTNPDDELAIGLALDNATNLYVTGWFDGANDFGGVVLTNRSVGGQDIFVAKYDRFGLLQWARRAGSETPYWNMGRGVGVDTNGNVYVTGGFGDDADFGTNVVSAPANTEFFLAKYDKGGTNQWVRQSVGGASGGVYGTGLAVDGAGNSYAVGFADNGATITFGTTNLLYPTFNGYSTFLVKYDNAGQVKWAQLFASSNQCYSTSVTLDPAGNVYVPGQFKSSLKIAGTNLSSTGGKDGFLAKFNNAGVLQWVRQMTGASDTAGLAAASVGASGSVYVAGGFGNTAGDTISFGNSIALTNIGGGLPGVGVGDAFLAKFNGSTATAQWARRAGGTNSDAYLGISLDSRGNVYVGGASGGTGLPDGFQAIIAKYDTNGVLQWTETSTGPNGALPFGGPLVDAGGNCYVAGWFQTSTVFGTNALTGLGYWDFFLAKVRFSPLALGIGRSNALPQLSVYGDLGIRFALEYVPAFAAINNWQPLVTNTLTSNPLVRTDTNSVGNPRRFYRARVVP